MVAKPVKKTSAATRTKGKTAARPSSNAQENVSPKSKSPKNGGQEGKRKEILKKILLAKREALTKQIQQQLGQSLTDEQQRRLESAMDSGDQALVDLEREMGISLQEMRNKERQLIEEALISLEEGNYGICAECGGEISEKRLEALPFARYCVACQSNLELMEKIEKAEQRQ